MTRDEFIDFVGKTLDEVKLLTEIHADRPLSNELKFSWLRKDSETFVEREPIIQEIVRAVFVDEDKIYPCVDLLVFLEDNVLSIKAGIANYDPRPFGRGWSNRPGPFIYAITEEVTSPKVDTQSKEFRNKMIDLGLWHCERE